MTEQDFEARILETLTGIDAARTAQPRRDAFQDVLERFARALSRHPAIGAAIETPVPPVGPRLVTWPKLRRDERTKMLYFTRQGDGFALLTSGRGEFRSPNELEEYLSQDFLRNPPFPDTLTLYEERCAMPVTGFLRRGGPSEVSPENVLVHLDPVEQRKLAEASPGQDVTVFAREDRMPLTSLYESEGAYTCLVAGGYGMWATRHARADDGRLQIGGSAMREDELS